MTLSSLLQFLAHQQVLAGFVGATLTGGLLYALRAVPVHIWRGLQELLTVTIVIQSHEEIYQHVNLWLAEGGAVRKVRRLMLQQEFDHDRDEWAWRFTLGQGWHLIWDRWRPILIEREVKDAQGVAKLLGGPPTQTLRIRTFGARQDLVRRIIAESGDIYRRDGRVLVYFWHEGCYHLADRRRPRPLSTVYLPAAQKRRLVEDAQRFVRARDFYAERGIPYRRGYFFEGPPGTGKTTLIFALAALLQRSVFVINLSNLAGDNQLLAAVNQAGPGIIVLEDIDAAKITRDRAKVEAERQALSAAKDDKAAEGVTLSGLLNAIDGIAAREGRLLFMTSNHPDQLDPALLRPGRIDVRETIGLLDHDLAWEMYWVLRPDGSRGDFVRTVEPLLPVAAAELQGVLLAGAQVIDLRPHADAATTGRADHVARG